MPERRRAERPALAAAAEPGARLVDALLAAHPDAYVCVYDRELRIREVLRGDDRARWGYAIPEVIGRGLGELLRPDEAASVLATASEVFATGEPRRMQRSFELPVGPVWCEVRLAPVRGPGGDVEQVLAIVFDVSERWRAEERLRESEARFATLARSLPVGVWRTDAQTRLEYANERLWQILELEPGPAADLDLRRISARAEATGRIDTAESARLLPAASLSSGMDFEMRWRGADGSDRWLHVRAEPQRDAAGAYAGRVGALTDVTELKRAQQELARHGERLNELVAERTAELERSHEALRRSERLAAVGSFAAGIAHQINNPVGGILLAAQFALAAPDDPERALAALRDITDDARRCGRIVRGVLEFARGPSAPPRPCDLNAIVRRRAPEIARDAEEHGARLRIELAEGPAIVAGSQSALEQVLVNLVWNAIEASAREIVVRSGARDGATELSVVDDGVGPPAPDPGQPFDALRLAGLARPGASLGLALAQGIAQTHGAELELSRRPGRGSAVSVRFPAAS